jgi:hypothetical protein
MLRLKNGFWTLLGTKYTDLNKTEKDIFRILFRDKLNKNKLCN